MRLDYILNQIKIFTLMDDLMLDVMEKILVDVMEEIFVTRSG